ncbi:MAG TPA: hypothetical protein VJT31_00530 [Rugosimonospora sp.]|nr:hypothetical protein [Rugosimonospora sp.]
MPDSFVYGTHPHRTADETDVERAEVELAAADTRDGSPDHPEVEHAESRLAAAEDGGSATPIPLGAGTPAVGIAEVPAAGTANAVGGADGVRELKPGEAEPTAVGSVWDDDARQDLRDRWRDVQLRFVDDPSGTVGEAQGLVDEALDRYTAALAGMRHNLDGWTSGNATDTEVLRAALRTYRDFLTRLLT